MRGFSIFSSLTLAGLLLDVLGASSIDTRQRSAAVCVGTRCPVVAVNVKQVCCYMVACRALSCSTCAVAIEYIAKILVDCYGRLIASVMPLTCHNTCPHHTVK